MRRLPFLVGLAGFVGAFAATSSASAAVWTNAGFATPPRNGHSAVALDDGRVLVAGAAVSDGNLASSVLFDPKTTTWVGTGSMLEGRAVACATKLLDGRVLVVGGAKKALEGSLASAEIYAPATGTWTAAAPMKVARFWAACVTLPDGRVVVAGGAPTPDTDSADLEIYDPAYDTWTTGPSMAIARHNPRAVLANGRVLVAGAGSFEEYDPATNTWRPPVTVPLARTAAVGLAGDRVLLVGDGAPSSFVYDPATGDLTPAGATVEAHRGVPQLVTLPNGRVLAVGGAGSGGKPLRSAEIFDPVAKTWAATDPLPDATALHTATSLEGGRVLVVGAGESVVMPAQIFNLVDGVACASNEECISGYCTDGVCCDRPCGGACEACDTAGSAGTCGPISGAPRAGHATCAPYLTCEAGACVTECTSDAQCSPGNVCFPDRKVCGPDKDLCGPNDTLVDRETGQATSCAPYACSPLGACLESCATSLDCASGHLCSDGVCVAPAPAVADEGGCAVGSSRAGGSFAALLGAFALLAARRRRRNGRLASLVVAGLVAGLVGFAASGCDPGAAEPSPAESPTAVARAESALEWSAGGTMKEPVRVYLTATPLEDGRVAIVGGSGVTVTGTIEAFDPATETWKVLGALAKPRAAHVTTRLADGRLLVTGGRAADETRLSSAEVFDPKTGTTYESPMSVPRLGHVAVALADGRVLVAGGARSTTSAESSAEIFDPASNTWSAAPPMSAPRVWAAAARLPDGRVLVASGVGGEATAEIFDPATHTWSPAPAPPTPRDGGALVADGAGRLILVGGSAREADVFDPASGTWRKGARASVVRNDAATVVGPSGQVIVLGGIDDAGAIIHDTYEIYDPVQDAWAPARRMTVPRTAHAAAALPSGRTLVVGGLGTLDEAYPLVGPPEILNLQQGAVCTKSAECASNFCVDGRCCDTWCAGACDACDLPGLEGTCSPVTGAPHPKREEGPKRPTCAPYGLCIEGACVTSCGSDAYCDEEHVCNTQTQTCIEPLATCDGDSTVTDKLTGETKSCAPYKCLKNGSCPTKCSSSDECVGGSACDGNTCRPATPTDDAGGCAIGAPGPTAVPGARSAGPGAAWALTIAVGLALGVRRRRA